MAETKQQKLAREMTHTRSSSQDQSTQPLDGSILKALVRGWIAGTAGIPGDLEGLARMGINKAFGAGGVNVDEAPALPTPDFYKQWLPGKQVGDENVAAVGSLFGGAGMGTIAKGTNKAARAVPGALTQMARNAAVPRTLSPQAGVIKVPGGNWLAGSVEDALKGLKRRVPTPADAADTPRIPWNEQDEVEAGRVSAMNSWIDKQLTRYVKNDMATERDPIRALAERGTLHVNPEQLNFRTPLHGRYLEEGQTAVAQSLPAKTWEGASDSKVFKNKAEDLVSNSARMPDTNATSGVVQKNPWLTKVVPETDVYTLAEPRQLPADLGFDHLIDELRNATNPNSGLPRELLLKPESLDRVSVPQAVEHVAKINAWREAQKVAANEAIANNAATHVFKEYAENNPKGLRWVELKQPKSVDQAAFANDPRIKKSLGDTVEGRGPRLALEDALKYEGDTMGHCVGGYCDDIASGRSRIYSLRDAKGQPHVTVEVAPKRNIRSYLETLEDPARPSEPGPLGTKWTLHDRVQRERSGNGDYDQYANKLLQELGLEAPQDIVQIKGKTNRKPNDEYLPFVQDFVRSGKWSDVGDLSNTGLKRLSDMGNEPMIQRAREKFGEYVTPVEWEQIMSGASGFAQGGPVREDAEGGANSANPALLGVVAPQPVTMSQESKGNPVAATLGAAVTDQQIQDWWEANKNAPNATQQAQELMRQYGIGADRVNRLIAPQGGVHWDSSAPQQFSGPSQAQIDYTAKHAMSRDDFIKKYALGPGGTFVADDKGGNAASEVAGQSVADYYDKYLAPGAKTTQTVSRGWDSDPAEQPIVWGHKYRDAHPYFDAYDNVNPHPKSQDLGGFGEFWRQVGRPVAAGVGMYLGAGALGNLAGAAPAATGSASGLAGQLGMGKGALATAFNTGALNTGVGVLRGQDLGTALKGGVTSALLSPVGGVVNNAVGGGALGTIAGRTATGALQGLATGRGLTDGLQQGVVSGVADLAGDYVGGQVGQATDSKLAGTLASSATKSALRGKGLSIDALASQYAAGKITDLAGLPPDIVKLLVNLARSKKGSTVGPLSRAKRA